MTSVHSRRDFYKIWVIHNKGTLTVGKKKVDIEQPAMVFLNPLETYLFEPKEQQRTGYWCIFTKEFLLHVIQHQISDFSLFELDSTSVFLLHEAQLNVVNFLFGQIIREYQSEDYYKYQSIRKYIELLVLEGVKSVPAVKANPYRNAASRITARFLNLLEKQYPIATPEAPLKLKKPGDFAGELAVHVNHLNAVVQEVTGKSTRNHIADRMISEGRALLHSSNWSVAEIAYSLGFEYPNHFNNFFKKHTGATPMSLRK